VSRRKRNGTRQLAPDCQPTRLVRFHSGGEQVARGADVKYLFRKLAAQHVPRDVVARKKHGFAVPLPRLLRRPLREPAGAALLDAGSLHAWLDRNEIERLWSAHQRGIDHR
jgi:hypothetical protein